MNTHHDVALAIAKLIREALHHDDGSLHPCGGGVLNPQWVAARANNIATAICGVYDVRPNLVSGEIVTDDDLCVLCGFILPVHDALLFGSGRAHAICVMEEQQKQNEEGR